MSIKDDWDSMSTLERIDCMADNKNDYNELLQDAFDGGFISEYEYRLNKRLK